MLTPQESNELFRTFRALTAHGKGVIFITHKLDEVLATADRITVIRQGKIVRTMDRAGVTKPMIAELMVGKPVLMEVDRPAIEPGRTVLEVRDLRVRSPRGFAAVDGISFSVRAGEVYGIAGVEGNGQSELCTPLPRASTSNPGTFSWRASTRIAGASGGGAERGHRAHPGGPAEVRPAPPLLHRNEPHPGPARQASLRHPPAAREHARGARIGATDHRAVRHPYTVREHAGERPVPAATSRRRWSSRELSAEPHLLVASQPTRGVDIGATEFIHRQIMKARSEGKAVLLISADLDELLALSDRIGVIFKGKIVREFPHEKALREEVGLAMTGGKSDVPA